MVDWINDLPKNKMQNWNDFAKREMQGKKSISLTDAMGIFDKYNINIDKSRLIKIANLDNNSQITQKELAISLFMLDGVKDSNGINWDGYIEDKTELGGDLSKTLLNQADDTAFANDLKNVSDAFDKLDASQSNQAIDGSELSKTLRSEIQKMNNFVRVEDLGKTLFGDNIKNVNVAVEGFSYELSDGSTVSYNYFSKKMVIDRANGQSETYNKDNKLIILSRQTDDKHIEKYIDSDADGIADVKTCYQKFNGTFVEVKRENYFNQADRLDAGDEPIKNRQINARVMFNILHDGSDGQEPVCF